MRAYVRIYVCARARVCAYMRMCVRACDHMRVHACVYGEDECSFIVIL